MPVTADVTRTHREILPELVEGCGHDAIRCVESLLHAIAVVDVNVDVKNALVDPAWRGRRWSAGTMGSRAARVAFERASDNGVANAASLEQL